MQPPPFSMQQPGFQMPMSMMQTPQQTQGMGAQKYLNIAEAEKGCCGAGIPDICGPPIWIAARSVYAYILILNLVWLIVNAATTAAAFSVISTPVYGYVVQQTVGWLPYVLIVNFFFQAVGIGLGAYGLWYIKTGDAAKAKNGWMVHAALVVLNVIVSIVIIAAGAVANGIIVGLISLAISGYFNFILWSHWQRCANGTWNEGGPALVQVTVTNSAAAPVGFQMQTFGAPQQQSMGSMPMGSMPMGYSMPMGSMPMASVPKN